MAKFQGLVLMMTWWCAWGGMVPCWIGNLLASEVVSEMMVSEYPTSRA